MRKFLIDFKAFALKGNVVELAVAVVIGTAFNAIVNSLVANILMPLFAASFGRVNIEGLTARVGSAEITYGVFLQSIINFVLIALSIFVAIRFVQRWQRKEEAKPEAEKVAAPAEEVLLLREIRDELQNK